ncbi:uncharacterized protein LOC106146083, partial [Columba livia]|uniref:uncharacterized protein LOC106146083 n=1 Tax=Columba livia TaxID=8932 RepID=UPI0031BB53DF
LSFLPPFRAELVSLLHSWQRLGGADIPKATSARLCPRCSARSFCNVSDALGADLLDRSCSIPDPQLVWRIVSRVEFYLSDENLAKDAFLLKHVQKNKMGFVRIKLLTSFKKVKFLTRDWKLTLYTLRFSELLGTNEEGTKVWRRVPIPESRLSIRPSKLLLAWELLRCEQDALSLLQKNFLETITRMFSPFGAIASIHILLPGRKLPSDACKYALRFPELLSRCCSLVEYESLGSSHRALVELGHLGGQSIRVVPLSRKGSKKKPEVVEELVDHPGLKAQATAATFPYDQRSGAERCLGVAIAPPEQGAFGTQLVQQRFQSQRLERHLHRITPLQRPLSHRYTRELQLLHFWLFLGIYLAALLGNGLIITTIAWDQHLHTPMYFFLLNLALLDLGCISTILPKTTANSLWDTRAISYTGCVAQLFLFVFSISTEYFLLTVMSYDRSVAICKPLHYGTLLPPFISSQSLDLVVSVLYSVVPPAVNPLIYSMRNQEVKDAVWKLVS